MLDLLEELIHLLSHFHDSTELICCCGSICRSEQV